MDVILTIMARAMGKWYSQHRIPQVKELMTLVPVNLRPPEEWTQKVDVGNVSTGILLPLPIRGRRILELHREISMRMAAKKKDPTSNAAPALAVPGVRLALYGKGTPRPGRKMGHLVALGDSPDGALARAREGFSRLGGEARKPFSI